MHRSASRLTRVLACAAVPVILTVAGCSSDSDKSSGAKDSGKKSEASSPAKPGTKSAAPLEKVAFAKLPDPCKAVTGKSIDSLVPEAKEKGGTAAKSNDLANRASCSWNGLKTDGAKGSQYRWLSVSLVRYDSHASLGSGNKRAEDQYNKQIELAKTTEGAHDVKTEKADGLGDAATSVSFGVKKDVDFSNNSIVVRAQNVVVTVDYNGAAYEGAGAPDQGKLLQDAITAAKETVAAIGAANTGEGAAPSGSASASASPSAQS